MDYSRGESYSSRLILMNRTNSSYSEYNSDGSYCKGTSLTIAAKNTTSTHTGMGTQTGMGGSVGVDNNGRPWFCYAYYSSSKAYCNIMSQRSDKDIASIAVKSVTKTNSYYPNSNYYREGYGIDAYVSTAGAGIVVTTKSNISSDTDSIASGLLVYNVNQYGTDAITSTLSNRDGVGLKNLGGVAKVRIVKKVNDTDYRLWVDGGNSYPTYIKLVCPSGNWYTGGWCQFTTAETGPSCEVEDFTWQGQRYILLATQGVNSNVTFKIYPLTDDFDNAIGTYNNTTPVHAPIASSYYRDPIGTFSYSSKCNQSNVCSAVSDVRTDQTNERDGVRLFMSVGSKGSKYYFMEECPTFNLAVSNGSPASETEMTRGSSAVTGTLTFNTIVNVTSSSPAFTIKHKNVLKQGYDDVNTLGATNLTDVTCVGCTRTNTTFTPTGTFQNGDKFTITVTYTDDLTQSTPVTSYTVTCKRVPTSLTVNPNGGTYNSTTETTTYRDQFASLITIRDAERTGYTFSGWTGTGVTNFNMVFDGVDDYVNLGREFMYINAITINTWAYMNNWSDYSSAIMRLFSCTEGGGWNIECPSGCINYACYDAGKVNYTSATSTTLFSNLSGSWHMFTLVCNGT